MNSQGNLKRWRALAKEAGVKKYSRMRKQDLVEAVQYARKRMIVRKGDLAVTRKLGKAFLRECEVAEWRNNGSRSRPFWEARAWRVPQSILDQHGLVPLSEDEVAAKNAVRSETSRRSYYDRLAIVAERIGAEPTGHLARAVAMGQCDMDDDLAQLVAYKARYRHHHTNYDSLLGSGHDREDARSFREADPIPETWDHYLLDYDLVSDEARALAAVLQSPRRCHPCWFKEAEIAIRRAGLDLSTLSYETIRDAIASWRAEDDR